MISEEIKNKIKALYIEKKYDELIKVYRKIYTTKGQTIGAYKSTW